MSNYGGLNKIPRLYAFGARGGEQKATLGGKVHNDGLTIGPEQITTFRMHGDTPKSPVKPNDAGEKSGKSALRYLKIDVISGGRAPELFVDEVKLANPRVADLFAEYKTAEAFASAASAEADNLSVAAHAKNAGAETLKAKALEKARLINEAERIAKFALRSVSLRKSLKKLKRKSRKQSSKAHEQYNCTCVLLVIRKNHLTDWT